LFWLYIQTRICLIILFILNILIDNAEKNCLEAKVDEIDKKQNEAIPKNIRGKTMTINSQTCIKRSPLEQRKNGLIKQVTS
jgi:hypothetical protein